MVDDFDYKGFVLYLREVMLESDFDNLLILFEDFKKHMEERNGD